MSWNIWDKNKKLNDTEKFLWDEMMCTDKEEHEAIFGDAGDFDDDEDDDFDSDDEDEDEVRIAELGEAAHARGPVLQLVPAEEEAGKQADDRGEDERLHAVVAYADGDDPCNDHVEKDRKSRESLRAVELQSEPLVFAVNPLMSQGKHRLSIQLLTSGPRSCAFY